MADEKMKWGEDKLIGEEALAGGLIFLAVWLTVAAAMINSGEVVRVINGTAGFFDYFTVGIAGVGSLAAFGFGFWFLGWQQSMWHYDGMQLRTGYDGEDAMQLNEKKLMSDAQQAGETKGVVIGGVELSRTREVGHISMFGLPGSGKTVLINNILHQVMQRGEKVIIHDPKGDFTSWVYGDDAVLLGPWDDRAVCWDIARDLSTPELATTFAGSLVGKGSGDNKYFTDAGREVIAGLLKYYIRKLGDNWSWDTLAEDLMIGGVDLVRKAQLGDPNVLSIITINAKGELEKPGPSVISTVGTAVSWILAYAGSFKIERDADGNLIRDNFFSIQRWLAEDDESLLRIKKVILNSNKNYEDRVEQIFGSVIASAANYLNSSSMKEISADTKGHWLILDEYVQMGSLASLYVQQIEELGRSRGVRVLKASQDESQLFAQVGREKGEAQRSVQQTRIYAKLALGSAAELSQKLGMRDIMRVEFPLVVGAGNKRTVIEKAPILRTEELTGLKILPRGRRKGVEIIVHTDDILVKLVQPFLSREITKEVHEKVIDSLLWKRGVLVYAERAEKIARGEDPGDLGIDADRRKKEKTAEEKEDELQRVVDEIDDIDPLDEILNIQ